MKVSELFGLVIGAIGTNWLDFWIEPVPDKDSELFFQYYFLHLNSESGRVHF